jgi:hypothetical protein
MAYLHSPSYHENLLPKTEKALHPFNEDHPFFTLSEIPSTSQNNISRIISIKNKTKVEKLLKRLDLFQFFDSIISNTSHTYKLHFIKTKTSFFSSILGHMMILHGILYENCCRSYERKNSQI